MEKNSGLYGKKILVVDDVSINRKIVRNVITARGGSVVCAKNGADALNLFEQSYSGEFSVILMDIRMPKMDGYETTIAIRSSKHSDSARIPIIALSSERPEEVGDLCLKSGMNLHMEKPFSPEKLISEIIKLSSK
ncbi:MAG: response regulator [Oscillospiraceae bacterium]|nr:response regulator [Oscillospiraceae bacterium]